MHFTETYQYSFSPSVNDIREEDGNRFKRIPELREKKQIVYKRLDK